MHDQRVRGHQSLRIDLIVGTVAYGIMVVAAPLRCQHWIKTFGIEIEQVDRMSRFLQSGQRFFANGGMKTIVKRMAIDIQHEHS